MSLVSFPSWGLTMEDLVERKGVYYEKFSDVPFTGQINEGLVRGSIKSGRRIDDWIMFWPNGQLAGKGYFKNGEREGYWELYKSDGTLWKEFTGTYKNGVKVND